MKSSVATLLVILAATYASAGMPEPQDVPLAAVSAAQGDGSPTLRRPRANGPVAIEADANEGIEPRRPRAGGTVILASGQAEPRLHRARANGVAPDE